MNETVQSTSSIAWFKLSELIKRGERERALSVFRLLSHSLVDKAFVALLEAELLHILGDLRAQDACLHSLRLYEETERLDEVVTVYAHLLDWWPNDDLLLDKLESFCLTLEQRDIHAWYSACRLLVNRFVAKQYWARLQDLIGHFDQDKDGYVWLKKLVVVTVAFWVDEKNVPEFCLEYCRFLGSHFLFSDSKNSSQEITRLLALLSSSSYSLYSAFRQELEG